MDAQGPREIELKLDLNPSDVPQMQALLTARFGAGAPAVRLSSVYYDTQDRRLEAERITLRVRRRDGANPIQTVKRSRSAQAGLFQRDEWETELATADPDLAAYARTSAGDVVPVEAGHLAPVFETVIERVIWQVVRGDTHVEIALDEGRVVAGLRSEPLAEVEVELKRGDPRDLFRILGDLGEIASLRPGVLAKSERGFRLARAKPPRASKAEPLHLSRSMTAADAFQRIGYACLRHFGLNAPLVVSHRAPAALHQARVALRRLRSALSLFKDLVDHPTTDALKIELRELASALGEARNLDVYLSGIADGAAVQREGDPDLAAFLAEVERHRTAAYDAVVARLESPGHRSLMLRLLEWLEAGAWLTDDDRRRRSGRDQPVRRAAAGILDKRRRRVKRQGCDLAALAPDDRHRVRIEAKKLRYAAEFFAGLARSPKRAKRHARFVLALEGLQEHLGALNDVQTAHEIAAKLLTVEGGSVSSVITPAPNGSDSQDATPDHLLRSAQAAWTDLAATKRFWSGWSA